MAKQVEKASEDKPAEHTLKVCPHCTATMFQGPFFRGPIQDGVLIKREEVYQCMNCHQFMGIEQLNERSIEIANSL